MQTLTVRAVVQWYEAHEVRDFSPIALRERRRLWAMFVGTVGDLPIEECRPLHLLEFIAAQHGVESNWTRRRVKATINKPFNVASQSGLIARNPFSGLRIPEGKSGRDWTGREFQSAMRHAGAYVRRLLVFVRFSGARPGEARALQWFQIREELDAIIQEEHKTAHATNEPRRIYFNRVIVKLMVWLKRNRSHRHYVFVNSEGRPWSARAITKYFAAIRRRGGLPPDMKLHGGRHSFATGAIMNGVDIATLAELLGHRNVATTQKYVHLVNKRTHLNAAANRAIGVR